MRRGRSWIGCLGGWISSEVVWWTLGNGSKLYLPLVCAGVEQEASKAFGGMHYDINEDMNEDHDRWRLASTSHHTRASFNEEQRNATSRVQNG